MSSKLHHHMSSKFHHHMSSKLHRHMSSKFHHHMSSKLRIKICSEDLFTRSVVFCARSITGIFKSIEN